MSNCWEDQKISLREFVILNKMQIFLLKTFEFLTMFIYIFLFVMRDLILRETLCKMMDYIFLKRFQRNLKNKTKKIKLRFKILLYLNVILIKTQHLVIPFQKVKLIIMMTKKKEFLLFILIDLLLILLPDILI